MVIKIEDLIFEIKSLLNELENSNPEKESLEWYLVHNLDSYLLALKEAKTRGQIKIATYVFRRFYLDSMDWDSPLFKQCSYLSKLASSVIKNYV